MKYTLIALFFVFLVASCMKNHEEPNIENTFIGTWVNAQYIDTATTISRSSELIDDQDGFQINSDGTFIQRANSGGCGTPPISYANYTGTWTLFPDNTLFIETEFWGGITSFKIEILLIENDKMIYRIVTDF